VSSGPNELKLLSFQLRVSILRKMSKCKRNAAHVRRCIDAWRFVRCFPLVVNYSFSLLKREAP
jgi:hypothetical protein